jgi:uncharacterized protein
MPLGHKILVSGASGFIGNAVVAHFKKQGYVVFRLVRHAHEKQTDSVYWNPLNEEINLDALEGFHAVIHLAGENVATRWTKEKKEAIFLSRVRHTWLLAHALARLKRPPKVFFSASAVGYYGDWGDEIITEQYRKGKGFLPDVCSKWEQASQILDEQKIRVIRARFGAVLSPDGGMLKRLVPIFRWGVGGKLGSGKQWMSWIGRDDLVRAIEFVITEQKQRGTYNFTSPNPVTNREFTWSLAKAVHRLPLMPVPAWAIKLIYGEMGKEVLLTSTRAIPDRLIQAGFQFEKPDLKQVLQF